MIEMDLWVARANITALKRHLVGGRIGERTELLRQLAEQEKRLDGLQEGARRP
jgi:hypothetical protein